MKRKEKTTEEKYGKRGKKKMKRRNKKDDIKVTAYAYCTRLPNEGP